MFQITNKNTDLRSQIDLLWLFKVFTVWNIYKSRFQKIFKIRNIIVLALFSKIFVLQIIMKSHMVFISRTFKFHFLVCGFTIELIPVVKIQTLFTKWHRLLLLIHLKMITEDKTAHNTNVEPGQSIEVLWLNQLRRQGIYSLVGFYFLLHPCLTTFLNF